MTDLRIENLSTTERERLEFIKRLIDEEEYKPDKCTIRKLPCWSEIAEALTGMPFEFRIEALDRYEEGIRVFGKVPVNETAEATEVISVKVVGPGRPMGCPEPPPKGAEFRLAWREGSLWNWSHGKHRAGIEMIGTGHYRPGFDLECTKYFDFLRRMEYARSKDDRSNAYKVLDLLECCDGNLQNPDAATGFYAGVIFSRLFLYAEADCYYADKAAVKKSEWPDIIAHALVRHGWKTTPQQLLALFGGQVDDSKDAKLLTKGKRPVTFPNWSYIPEEEKFTLEKFSEKVKDVKKRRKPKSPRNSSHMSRLRQLLK